MLNSGEFFFLCILSLNIINHVLIGNFLFWKLNFLHVVQMDKLIVEPYDLVFQLFLFPLVQMLQFFDLMVSPLQQSLSLSELQLSHFPCAFLDMCILIHLDKLLFWEGGLDKFNLLSFDHVLLLILLIQPVILLDKIFYFSLVIFELPMRIFNKFISLLFNRFQCFNLSLHLLF